MNEETRGQLAELYGDRICERCGQPLLDGGDINFVMSQDLDAFEFDPETGNFDGTMHYRPMGKPHYSHGRHPIESKTYRHQGIFYEAAIESRPTIEPRPERTGEA